MATEIDQLHVLFFPLMAQGHILPTIDTVSLFAARGVKTSIITTTHNAHYFTKTIEKTQNSPIEIGLKVSEFPAKQAGLPEGFENLDLVSNQELHRKFFDALSLLQHPLGNLMQELCPHALVADMFFPWATALASKYGVPRLIFHVTSFSICAMGSIIQYNPHKTVSSDNEKFVLPKEEEKAASINEHEYCLKWLGSKKPNSVVYVWFGTTSKFPASQLREIALGLEASGLHACHTINRQI